MTTEAPVKLPEPRMNKYIPWRPTPKQRLLMLLTGYEEVLFGGAAGPGKSAGLLMAALQYVDVPGYNALLLRRTYADLAKPEALIPLSHEWLGPTDATWNEQQKRWTFPSGATLNFGYLEHENDKYHYQGAAYQFVGFDELTQFSASQYAYVAFSRGRRRVDSHIPIRIRAASNPGGIGHTWVKQRFLREGRENGRLFIPAKLQDNPYIDQATYTRSLMQLDAVTRAHLLNGDWDIGAENAILPHFDRNIHVVELPDNVRFINGAFGADYGRVHKSAAAAVSVDQFNRKWVREVWARPSDDHGTALEATVSRFRDDYKLRSGRVDPNQDHLAGTLRASLAKSGEGSRQHRINLLSRLLDVFPGGLVPTLREELNQNRYVAPRPLGPYGQPDSPGLLIVKGCPGSEELCNQIEAYHYEHKLTDVRDEMVVARIDEDMVAALEYAIEELEEGKPDYSALLSHREVFA